MTFPSKILSALSAFFAVKQRSGLNPSTWLRGEDIEAGEGAKLLSPYSQSAWVYIAISVLAENVAQIPFRITRIPPSAKQDLNAKAQRSKDAKNFTEANRGNGERNSVSSVHSCSSLRTRVMAENLIESG